MPPIKTLFANDIDRRIEEVIKVDQADETIIRDELAEYVVTSSILSHLLKIFEHYLATWQKPNEGIAVWISGFFGSGKSGFAKYIGLALANRYILGQGAGELLARRCKDTKARVLLTNIAEQIPTEAVIFDVSTDRGIRTGNQSITEIMYRLFLQSLGYARDLDLSELEITLEEAGGLDAFKAKYREVFAKDWDVEKGKIAIAVQQASRVMHALEPATYATADSWRESAMKRADITPGDLATRCMELMSRRRPGKTLLFVIDEVGQFVARDVQKMLDLQAVVQSFGRVGRGKLWILVTSQEKLTELVGGLDDRRVELARLMDRFPSELQVHLEPSDISEVTSQRVLAKNAEAEKTLRERFTEHRGRLTDNTRLTADITLPELTADAFIELYPLLPYQIDLIIQIVSGLRTQGGASKHVGGANRTIIKLAQQLLIHPDVDLANQPLGALARVDQIYDLVSGNIGSEIRAKIADIGTKIAHPLAQPVAKTICLLQYVRSVHRTAENIAAALHPAIDADSRLAEVRQALDALEKGLMVRRGDDGYRIPTPAEDDWERQRSGLVPKPGDTARLHAEAVTALWQPQPSHNLLDVKPFKAGLYLGERLAVEGDIPFHLTLAETGTECDRQVEEFRRRSQTETKAVFWVAAIGDAIDRETVELHRSKDILSRKERGAQTKDESALVAEEKIRQRRHQDEVRRLVKQSLLTGTIFFRGNDRSPDEGAGDVSRSAAKVLSQALPEVFDRFEEAAARVAKADLDALLTTENLRGLTPVYTDLGLVRDQVGKPTFNVETGVLAEVLARIENRTSYGETASGRWLTDEFAKEPFGWEFDTVRLLVIALLRAGKIEATSKGQVIDSALSLEARTNFTNNNLFRQASFRPRTTDCAFTDYIEAGEAYKTCFGKEIQEYDEALIAQAIRETSETHEETLREVVAQLDKHGLPGSEVIAAALSNIVGFRRQRDCQALKAFTACHQALKEAIKRGAELANALTEPALHDLGRARKALDSLWPFLEPEPDLGDADREHAERLKDLLARESFFRELPAIDQHTKALETAHQARLQQALDARARAYADAIQHLRGTPGWEDVGEDQRDRIAEPLATYAVAKAPNPSIPQLRADLDACPVRRDKAIEELMRLIDGNRVVKVSASSYFAGGIENEEQLDQALDGLKEQCLELIAAGKKVLVQ
ncbi:MAG: BREX system P-loop protein BrxC [Thiocapsa sp.]|uniref:BREX system P-loop protein BrxC n=1 Tax=Thiocapsa sp. TaxID=2024551 RepID=UPI001BCF9C37|nr:BREX system P-loop protein BrxC [Thiocapsa sp.]QVL47244.1 MAG: BREX system P-loop protein BrxC [Thiocapsa sp.]